MEYKVGVVISTYNNPKWLEKTLWGYMSQNCPADEIVIADDGSGEETTNLINSFSSKLPIKRVWHEDVGFRKSEILNKALLAATADYLIFTDQDCIPRRDFIETHKKYARKGRFLSGGYFKLPMSISCNISFDDVSSGRAFDLQWLRNNSLPLSFKYSKLIKNLTLREIIDKLTPARASWNGCNSSGWRQDMLLIKGFNEQMRYGGQDREFGERLVNAGFKSKQIRHQAIVLHLDHKRPYKTKESIDKNIAIRRETRRSGIIETPFGIR